MNTRIKAVRKSKKMTQNDFASVLGITGSAITQIEKGNRNPSNQVILAIIREFNVNEEWLRYGTGGIENMFAKSETFSLDEFVKKQGASELELKILKAYFELDQDIRKKVIEHFKHRLSTADTSDS